MMKTGVVLYINHDLCALYVVEEQRCSFAFIPKDFHQIQIGCRYVVYKQRDCLSFFRKEVSLC